MRKRILAILLAVCMTVGMMPAAFAVEPSAPVARIEVDGKMMYYDSLSLAVEAVSDGGTITLMADVTGTVAVSREVAFRLEMGPYHCELQAGHGFQITMEGNLYIVAKIPTLTSKLYRVKVADADSGVVVASPFITPAGSAVLLTVTPDKGYVLDSLTVKDEAGGFVALTSLGQGVYLFRMPKSDVTVSASFAVIFSDSVEDCPRDQSCPASQFTDINLALWYHDGIHYAVENHLMNGTGEHLFSPNTPTTRAMLVTVLFRFEGGQSTGRCPFADVQEGMWYTDAITWAAANQIVEGYGNGQFGPDDPITREQMATILWRYAALKGYDVSAVGDLSAFTDGNETAIWAWRGMEWAVGEGLIIGKENHRLDPQGNAIRCQFATIMMRFCRTAAE